VILTVDTSTRAFSLSLFENEESVAHIELKRALAHSQQIVQVFEFMLHRIGLTASCLTAAYAGTGPGSFTGTRIGLSFVNTLSQILNIPILGVSSLDLLAFDGSGWYNSAVTLLRSRKNEVYTASYQMGERKTDYQALTRDEFLGFLEKHSPQFVVAPEEDFRDLGNLEGRAGKIKHAFPSSRSLYFVVRERGLMPRRNYLKPIYVRGI
jgi:tRNA threonylcarbamoyl adenosine modification protein YeaZ